MKKILFAFLLCLALLLTACQGSAAPGAAPSVEPAKQSRVIFYFDTVVTITAYTDDEDILSEVEEEYPRHRYRL